MCIRDSLRPLMGPADDHLKLNGESIGTQRKLSNQVWWSGSALSSICVHFIPSIGPEEQNKSMNKVLVISIIEIISSIKLFYMTKPFKKSTYINQFSEIH